MILLYRRNEYKIGQYTKEDRERSQEDFFVQLYEKEEIRKNLC